MGLSRSSVVTIRVNEVEGVVLPGSRLRVSLMDSTSVDEVPIEITCMVLPEWDGSACVVELAAPTLDPSRDYTVIAHAGVSDDISSGDWITTDNFRIADRVAQIYLARV